MGAVIRRPTLVPRPVPESVWTGRSSPPPQILLAARVTPFIHALQTFYYDVPEQPLWVGDSTPSPRVLLDARTRPFLPPLRTFNYDIAGQPLWTDGSQPPPLVMLTALVRTTPFLPSQWKFHYEVEGQPKWTGASIPSGAALIQLNPSKVLVRSNIYVPRPAVEPLWTGVGEPVSILLFPVLAVTPIGRVSYWPYNYDVAGQPLWTGVSQSANWTLRTTLQLYAASPMVPRFYGDLDKGNWYSRPQSSYIQLIGAPAAHLFGNVRVSLTLSSTPTVVLPMSGSTLIAATMPNGGTFGASLAADTTISPRMSAGLTASAHLAARTLIAAVGKAAITTVAHIPLALSAGLRIAVQAKATITTKTALAGRTTIATFAKFSTPGALALFGATFVKMTMRMGMAATVKLSGSTSVSTQSSANVAPTTALAATTAVKVATRAGLLAVAPVVGLIGTIFIKAFLQAALSIVGTIRGGGTLYPRIIEVHRLRTVAAGDPIGLTGYSGAEQSTDPADPQGEIVLFTGIPASIQATAAGRKKDSTLAGDAVFAPTWNIFVPLTALPRYSIRDRDIILDDEGYRYEVGQGYWNLLGYKAVCIRLEA